MTEYALAISDEEIRRYTMMAERAHASEADLWARAGIVPGAIVADVGCGPAALTIRMACVVGPSGRVIGIEPDEAALTAARQLISQAKIDNVELRRGTATNTALAAESVDVAVTRHVLAHNGADEQNIVNHIADLVRPGGYVYLVDVDGTAVRMLDADTDLGDLSEKYLQFHRRRGNDLMVGLRLRQLLARAGLDPVVFEGRYSIISAPAGVRPPSWAARDAMVTEQAATPQDVQRWRTAFERMDSADVRPTVFAPNFFAIGAKSA
jgi:ubiquinone/menaquinone biosynthesis C-methylase UbiE